MDTTGSPMVCHGRPDSALPCHAKGQYPVRGMRRGQFPHPTVGVKSSYNNHFGVQVPITTQKENRRGIFFSGGRLSFWHLRDGWLY